MTGLGAVAAWTSPVLVLAVIARVTTGGAEAPLFVLAALTTPLLALLATGDARAPRSGFAFTAVVVTLACVLGAGFRAVTDVSAALALEPGATLGSLVALVLVTTLWPSHYRIAAAALMLATGALVTALVIVGIGVGVTPWTAWSEIASRTAFHLGPRSAWTTGDGARFTEPITLAFTESHQVTATTAAVLRVTEHDRPAPVVREWRLAAGDSLLLRPGDTLTIPAETRVRFQAGKRVPGSPVSGVAWADRADQPRPRLVAWWLALTATLAGGALTLIGGRAPLSRASALLGPPAALGVTLAAACWAVYALHAAPELSIGSTAAAALGRLGPVVADEPWRSRLLTAVVLALVALLLGSAASFRQRLVELAAVAPGRLAASARRGVLGAGVWIVLVLAAAGASVAASDGWSLFLQGAGLAAATLLGPLVATGNRPDSERASARGALVGALLFVILTVIAHWPAGVAGRIAVVAQYPALVAVPGAWLVATLARASDGARTARGRTSRGLGAAVRGERREP
jgi:hypothetical protein